MALVVGPVAPPVLPATSKTTSAAPTAKPPAPAKPDTFQRASEASAAAAFGTPNAGPSGAYYRKVVSEQSTNLQGIHTSGVLPSPTFDPKRETAGGPKDIPDVYVGGTSSKGAEVDCGLAWNRVQDDSGRLLYTDNANGSDGGPNGADPSHQFHFQGLDVVDGNGNKLAPKDPRIAKLKPDFAYHPYFRTDYRGKNTPGNRDPGDSHLSYYYPGQAFSMQFSVDKNGAAELAVNSPTGPSFAAHFQAPGFDGAARSFKRVISIDQEGPDHKAVAATKSTLTQGGWGSVNLIRTDGTQAPLTPSRGTLYAGSDTLKSYDQIFRPYYPSAEVPAEGGEYLDITPSDAKK